MDLPEMLGGYAEESAIAERSVGAMDELIAQWKRSRERDGDSEFMAGRRAGKVDALALLLDLKWATVRDALERGQL